MIEASTKINLGDFFKDAGVMSEYAMASCIGILFGLSFPYPFEIIIKLAIAILVFTSVLLTIRTIKHFNSVFAIVAVGLFCVGIVMMKVSIGFDTALVLFSLSSFSVAIHQYHKYRKIVIKDILEIDFDHIIFYAMSSFGLFHILNKAYWMNAL